MPKKKISPETKTDRTRTEGQKQLIRAGKELRTSIDGLVYVGIKANRTDNETAATGGDSHRVTIECSEALANELLTHLAETSGMAWAPEDYATTTPAPKATAKPDLTTATTLKELRKIAKDHGIVGAAKMNKTELLDALT